jgi:hypothetical protein
MFVGGTGDLNDEDLRSHFAAFGTIEDAAVRKGWQVGACAEPVAVCGVASLKLCCDQAPCRSGCLCGRQLCAWWRVFVSCCCWIVRAFLLHMRPPPSTSLTLPHSSLPSRLCLPLLLPFLAPSSLPHTHRCRCCLLPAQVVRREGMSRGFGFITFDDEVCVEKCLLVSHFIRGRKVELKRAVPKEEIQQGAAAAAAAAAAVAPPGAVVPAVPPPGTYPPPHPAALYAPYTYAAAPHHTAFGLRPPGIMPSAAAPGMLPGGAPGGPGAAGAPGAPGYGMPAPMPHGHDPYAAAAAWYSLGYVPYAYVPAPGMYPPPGYALQLPLPPPGFVAPPPYAAGGAVPAAAAAAAAAAPSVHHPPPSGGSTSASGGGQRPAVDHAPVGEAVVARAPRSSTAEVLSPSEQQQHEQQAARGSHGDLSSSAGRARSSEVGGASRSDAAQQQQQQQQTQLHPVSEQHDASSEQQQQQQEKEQQQEEEQQQQAAGAHALLQPEGAGTNAAMRPKQQEPAHAQQQAAQRTPSTAMGIGSMGRNQAQSASPLQQQQPAISVPANQPPARPRPQGAVSAAAAAVLPSRRPVLLGTYQAMQQAAQQQAQRRSAQEPARDVQGGGALTAAAMQQQSGQLPAGQQQQLLLQQQQQLQQQQRLQQQHQQHPRSSGSSGGGGGPPPSTGSGSR